MDNNLRKWRLKLDIRCRKLSCKFNDHFTCKAKAIEVSKTSICKNYVLDSTKPKEDTTKNLFERTPKYSPMRDSKTITIKCNAKCLLNHEGFCVANGITLNDYRAKPYCLTFLEK